MKTRLPDTRATIKKETQFNRQVELNMKMKELEKQLQTITAEL